MIFLNGEAFMEEAIASVLAQTYSHWELLLVDDGSTDGSTGIAKDYAARYPERIRYLEHPGHANRGMSATRNLGVQNARGQFISYIDCDDVWLPHKLEQQVDLLAANPTAAMVYAPLYCWYSWTGRPEDQHKDHLYGIQLNGLPPYSNSLVEPPDLIPLFLKDKNLTPSGVLVKREVLQTIAPSEESFRTDCSDDVVQIKICLNCRVFVSDEWLYKYRIHPESSCRVEIKAGKSHDLRLTFLNWVSDYFEQQSVTDSRVWKALKAAYFPYHQPRLFRVVQQYLQLRNILESRIITTGRKILPQPLRHWLWLQWVKLRGGQLKE